VSPLISVVVVDLLGEARRKKKERKNYASSKKAAHINQGKGAAWEEKPLYQKRKGWSVRIRKFASRQASRPLLISLKVRRKRHLDYCAPYSDTQSQKRNSESSTYHERCALPAKRALVTHSPCIIPIYMFLDLPQDLFSSVARLRLCAHTL